MKMCQRVRKKRKVYKRHQKCVFKGIADSAKNLGKYERAFAVTQWNFGVFSCAVQKSCERLGEECVCVCV